MFSIGQTLRAAAKSFGAWVKRGKSSPENEALPESMLVLAAEEFVEVAHAADRFAENEGFYKRVEDARVKFTRLVRTPAFIELTTAVNRATRAYEENPKKPVDGKFISDVLERTEKLKKILSDPRAAIFQIPFEYAKRLDIPYKGPLVHSSLNRLFDIAFHYRATQGIEKIIREQAKYRPRCHPSSAHL